MDKEIPIEERRKAKRRNIIKISLIAGGCIAAIAIAVTMIRPSVSSKDITLSTAERGTIEASVSATGKVAPAFEEIITSPVASRILEVYCHEGDSVDIGTPLLSLDLRSTETELGKLSDERRMKANEVEQTSLNTRTYLDNLEMQIKVKEMAVNRLAAEVANERRLDSIGSGTGDKVHEAQLAYNTGKLELAQLRNQLANERRAHRSSLDSKRLALNIFEKDVSQMQQTLDDAHIKSPRRGTLTFIDNQLGRQVTVGEKVAVISDLTRFKVSGEIAESMGDRVSVGSGVIVRLGSTSLQGTVSNLTPKSTDGSVSFTVKLDDDDNPRLRAGQKVQIFVLYEVMDNVVRIANGSYYKGPGDYELFVQTADNELTRRKVKIGAGNYDYVEVMSGISPGENVVVSDMTTYQKNNKLKIK